MVRVSVATALALAQLLVNTAQADELGRERKLESPIRAIGPGSLSVDDHGVPPSYTFSYSGDLSLFPQVDTRLDWEIHAGAVLATQIDYIRFDGVGYSPGGARLEFDARKVGNWFAIMQPIATADFNRLDRLIYKPVWIAGGALSLGDKDWSVSIGGRAGQSYRAIAWLTFDPQGKQIAYAARKRMRWTMVVGTKEMGDFEQVENFVFGPGGKFAFAARPGLVWQVVTQAGTLSDTWEQIDWPIFSSDGGHLAYPARRGTDWQVVLDGKPGDSFDMVDRPVFSPNGRELAHTAQSSGRAYVVRAGRRSQPYDRVAWPTYSPDGKRFAFMAQKGAEAFLVVDGKEQSTHTAVDWPVFSDDSRSLAYRASDGQRWTIVQDGKTLSQHEFVGRPLFAPKGTKLAFAASKDGRWVVVAGKAVSAGYDWVGAIRFSRDGRRVGFGALSGSDLWWKVMEVK